MMPASSLVEQAAALKEAHANGLLSFVRAVEFLVEFRMGGLTAEMAEQILRHWWGCRECDMCACCETHDGCLTDLGHLEWFMQFASPGETACNDQGIRYGETFTCAKPARHGGQWHMARTGDGWK
ncbi:hypothetical protein ACIBCT_21045 [Streptosporangium sp. NPDC050855]|uniref:hypothetical protein n=1 Tax=Streptosporangium sp. NPDC050855 TaxID=3366194 RepID=UPI003795C643